ncbi:MAG: nucleotidyltransferase domain-containing protein [Planctomycetes bacterium]|nr:nucleotidyltransferase domain-containing protein [Planctomycetota bacterium]
MVATPQQKEKIKKDIAACLRREKEVCKVVVFGSFLTSTAPNDLDVAIFQDSDETYLPLAQKYRRLLRPVADQIPIDVIPIRSNGACGEFLAEIQKGEVVYER